MRHMADSLREMRTKQAWPCVPAVYRDEREAGDQWDQINKEQEQVRYHNEMLSQGYSIHHREGVALLPPPGPL